MKRGGSGVTSRSLDELQYTLERRVTHYNMVQDLCVTYTTHVVPKKHILYKFWSECLSEFLSECLRYRNVFLVLWTLVCGWKSEHVKHITTYVIPKKH